MDEHEYFCFSCKYEWNTMGWIEKCPQCKSKNISYLTGRNQKL